MAHSGAAPQPDLDAQAVRRRFEEYLRTGDRELRNRLIEEHRPLALQLARHFSHRGEPPDDLGQVAMLALLKNGHLKFAAARNEATRGLEQSQEDLQVGPCRDAFRSGEVVTSEDLSRERRWPEFTRLALDQGMQAVAGIPMGLDERRLGAFNIYPTPRAWTSDEPSRPRACSPTWPPATSSTPANESERSGCRRSSRRRSIRGC